jgi:hypothetical protein
MVPQRIAGVVAVAVAAVAAAAEPATAAAAAKEVAEASRGFCEHYLFVGVVVSSRNTI